MRPKLQIERAGFTLLEMMLALTIGVLLMGALFVSLKMVVDLSVRGTAGRVSRN